MNCQNCKEVVEAGAVFCGNCGQPLQPTSSTPISQVPTTPTPASPIAQVLQSQSSIPATDLPPPLNGPLPAATGGAAAVPAYALATSSQHAGERKAWLSLLFGIAGVVGGLFIALIGLTLGIAGLVMGTMSRSGTKRGISTAGLFVSSLSVLVSLAVWTYAIKHDPALQQGASQPTSHSITAPAVSLSDLSTPCYSAGFVDKLNVSNNTGSCDMAAYNGTTLENSTDAYKVYANQSSATTTTTFISVSKQAIEKDVSDNLPGFTIDSEKESKFAGSPAYIVSTADNATGIAIVEAAVLHQVGHGENIFVLVHAVSGRTTDLSTLEAQWQWK